MRTVTVAGANLYQLALQYLGAADQWNRIAQANGLIDPVVTGTATLLIPSIDANAGGGVFVPAQ
jgi:hypothetical protein